MDQPVCVIGTTFVDCKGFALNNYHPGGRNLGNIVFVHGGVGRNIAENMANLGLSVRFISTVDRSATGAEVTARLKRRHVDTSAVLEMDKNGMGYYLAILDENGDLAGSISQMPDLAVFEQLIISRGKEIMESAAHVVLEIDLNATIARAVIEISARMQKPVYGIPGNLDVVLKNTDIISALECFICNDIEAGRITGEDLSGLDPGSLTERLSRHFFTEGIRARHTVVTLGSRGAVYCDSLSGAVGHQPAVPTGVVDTIGAGDAFFSGTVAALTKGWPLKHAVAFGAEIASLTIATPENICPVYTGKDF